jgi:EAL domain-containing protein (putative c-di-GMP-specific phosphodiesterase class I)
MPNIDRMLDYAHSTEKKVRNSRNEGFEFYNHEQWEKGKQIANIINALPTAIESGDIQVWYQPQFDYKIGEITGAEALVRWKYEKQNYLKPEYFIPILEESGLIYNLDCFAWEQVCIDLNRWNKEGYHRHVSINVSRIDIREDRDISKHLNDLIKKYNISPDQLRIEITESAYVENHDILINTTKKLREIGFQVEMDDFGSGYSSLNMLKEVPVDRIKLDLNFLTSSGDSTKSHIILSCIIKMINLLGIKIIAEGVETIEQASFLEKQGCYEMQGYYFYKPMTVEEYEQLSKDNIKSKND